MGKAKIIYANGTNKDVAPKNGKDFSYEELREIVDGYIEIVQPKDPKKIMVINEEGKLLGLELNLEATKLYGQFPFDVIVGDVLYCDSDMVK